MVLAIGSLLLLSWVLGGTFLGFGLLLLAFTVAASRRRKKAEGDWLRVDALIVGWEFVSIGDSEGYFARYAYTSGDGAAREGRPIDQRGFSDPQDDSGPALLLVDPKDPQRFFVDGDDSNTLLLRITAALLAFGAIGIALASSGVLE